MALTQRQRIIGIHPDPMPTVRFKLLDELSRLPGRRREVGERIYGTKVGAGDIASAVGWARTHRLVRLGAGQVLRLTDAGHLALDFARLVGPEHVFPAGSAGPVLDLPLLPCEQDA